MGLWWRRGGDKQQQDKSTIWRWMHGNGKAQDECQLELSEHSLLGVYLAWLASEANVEGRSFVNRAKSPTAAELFWWWLKALEVFHICKYDVPPVLTRAQYDCGGGGGDDLEKLLSIGTIANSFMFHVVITLPFLFCTRRACCCCCCCLSGTKLPQPAPCTVLGMEFIYIFIIKNCAVQVTVRSWIRWNGRAKRHKRILQLRNYNYWSACMHKCMQRALMGWAVCLPVMFYCWLEDNFICKSLFKAQILDQDKSLPYPQTQLG